MKNLNHIKAGITGISILVAAPILYFCVLLDVSHHEALRVTLLFSPALSAFLAAYLAPRKKILLGISMGIWGAVIGVIFAFAYERFGFVVDSIGGPLMTFAIHFIYDFVMSLVGCFFGYYLSVRKVGEVSD